MAIYAIISAIVHFYLGFNAIINWFARIVNLIENAYNIRVWKPLSKYTNFPDEWLTFHWHIESQWVTISSFPYIQYLLLFSVLHLGLKVKYITRYEDMSNIPVPTPSTTDPVHFFILFYNYLRTNYSLTGWQWWVCYILKYFSNQSHWILDKWGWRVSVQTSWEC